jgi:hypothetical protein
MAPKKIHLKRNATDRLALCGIWPEHRFVLLAAVFRQPVGTVCKMCRMAAAIAPKGDGGPSGAKSATA